MYNKSYSKFEAIRSMRYMYVQEEAVMAWAFVLNRNLAERRIGVALEGVVEILVLLNGVLLLLVTASACSMTMADSGLRVLATSTTSPPNAPLATASRSYSPNTK